MDSEERIRECLTKMIFKDSYWGYLFSNVTRIVNEEIPTLFGVCINEEGHINLHYNPRFLDLSKDDVIEKVLEHEGFHLLDKHLIRLNRILEQFNEEGHKQIIELWNYASDMSANYLGHLPKTITVGEMEFRLIHAEDYGFNVGLSSEMYFSKLLDKTKDQKSGNGEGKGESKFNGKGRLVGDHSGWKSENGEASNFIEKKAEKEINDLIYKSFKNVRDRGNLPGKVKEMIDEALKPPKVPYYYIIRKLVKGSRLAKLQKAYTKVNRKRLYSFFIDDILLPFPGVRKDMTFKIGVLIDTSGSMDMEKIKEGLSGVKDIVEKDKDCLTFVIECDTCVQKEYEVKKITDIQYQVKGRGGTILYPGLARCKELGVDVVLAFTDAYCENINQIDRKLLPKKIIWIVPETSRVNTIDQTGYIVRVNM